MNNKILIIDDEQDIRELVAGILDDEGYETAVCSDSDSAIELLSQETPQLIFLDVWLEGSRLDGLALLNFIKNNYSNVPVIMISGHGTVDTAVSAIKRGAYDFIEKPFNTDRLLVATERALEISKLRVQVDQLKKQTQEKVELIGNSAVMKKLRHNIEKIAPTNSRVMLIGGSGTGKETVAKAIHYGSHRADGPFVIMNVSSYDKNNLEEQLFGCEFSDGRVNVGLLEKAHMGTLYIDELGDIPLEAQNRLLKLLSVNSFRRKNGVKDLISDIRIISATSKDIELLVEKGKFRQDLFHRLSVVPIHVPSLSERREDIPILIEYFIDQIVKKEGLVPRQLAPDLIELLQYYSWPGNVRQLKNNIERLMILADNSQPGEGITIDMMPPEICDPLAQDLVNDNIMSLPLREAREEFEKKYLRNKIEMCNGVVSKAADNIGMERSALHRKLKKLNIEYRE